MNIHKIIIIATVLLISLMFSCKTPTIISKSENRSVPNSFGSSTDTLNCSSLSWKDYFNDPNLINLIELAIDNNQELNIVLQEIEISKNEIKARKGEYLPFVTVNGGLGIDKPGRYTRNGAVESNLNIEPNKEFPEPLQDYQIGLFSTWEIDIWKKLRNAKKAAASRYLASIDGKNFLLTNLISEIANSFYELLALDNQLLILKQNIEIQNNALQIVKLEKEAAKVNELAVKRFEAHVLNTRGLQYDIQQKIIETENKINFLIGRYPQPIIRNSTNFLTNIPDQINTGLPSQLLSNRPDIKQAEHELAACKLDLQVAKARFYPSIDLSAGIGLQAFNPAYLITKPESILFSLAGDLVAPLINKNAIKSLYYNANAKQIQAIYEYERTILTAYIEVVNQLANIENLRNSFQLKTQEVDALTQSITISNSLFKSARADYMEVLLTQRDALESRFELVETKMSQMHAFVNIYRSLGGGWR